MWIKATKNILQDRLVMDNIENKKLLSKKRFAFNIWDFKSAKAVIDASKFMDLPIFLQISSKIFPMLETEGFIFLVKNYILKNNADVIIHRKRKDIVKLLKLK